MPFEAFLQQKQAKPTKGRRLTIGLSLGAHGALAIAAVVHSFCTPTSFRRPTVTVTFLAAMPPPRLLLRPPKKKSTPTKTVTKEIVQPKPNELMQPKSKEEVKEEEGDGERRGRRVVGGVVGGVVEAPVTPPPPPPPSAHAAASFRPGAAQFLAPNVAAQNLLTNPMYDKQYRVGLAAGPSAGRDAPRGHAQGLCHTRENVVGCQRS